MNAELDDLAARLEGANRMLLGLATRTREKSLSVSFDGARHSVEADRLEAKASGIRLALSYVDEMRRADA